MDEINEFEALRQSPLSTDMTDDQVRVLGAISTCRALKNDEVLISDGETDNSFHVIIRGLLAVTKDAGAGDWTTLHVLRPGDLAGALGFVDGRAHTATLRAVGDNTAVCSIERERFESLVESDPWVTYRVMQGITRSVHDILRRMNTQYVEMNNYITKQHGRY